MRLKQVGQPTAFASGICLTLPKENYVFDVGRIEVNPESFAFTWATWQKYACVLLANVMRIASQIVSSAYSASLTSGGIRHRGRKQVGCPHGMTHGIEPKRTE